MADVGLELVKVLVGYSEANTVFAKFGKHVGQRQCCKALKFVDVDKEVSSIRRRHVNAAIGGNANRSHEQPAQKRRAVLGAMLIAARGSQDLARFWRASVSARPE